MDTPPFTPLDISNKTPMADHDLLIEVSTNVKNLSTILQTYIADNASFRKDHEDRIRAVEKRQNDQDGQISGSRRTFVLVMTVVGLLSSLSLAITAYVGLKR